MFTALLLAACAGPTPPEIPAPEPEATQADPALDEAALGAAREAAKKLGGTLKTQLVGTLKASGPLAAADMCSTSAQGLTEGVEAETHAKLGRSSLRLRNSANAAPDWVSEWLSAQGERPFEGVEGIARVEDTPGGRVARVLVPVGIDEPCLQCHGPVDGMQAEVRELLAERFPDDAAIGYAVGELRGALWSQVAVAAP